MNYKKEIETLLETLKELGISRGKIEQELDYADNYIDQVLSKGGNRKFWLRLKNYTNEMLQKEIPNVLRETSANYLKTRWENKIKSQPYLVPLVPVKAQAGYASRHDQTEFIQQLEMYPILPGIDPRGAVWRYFEIQGDSMEPGLYDTDLVLVSQVPQEDWKDIRKGQVYVIVTNEDVLIKLIYPHDKENWVLKSSNKRHKEKLIKIEDIKELWYYRRHVTNKIQWPKGITQ